MAAAALAILAAAAAAPLSIDTGHQGAITALALDSRREILASASTDGAVRVWDLKARRQEAVLAVSRIAVQRLAIAPESSLIAAVENPTPRTARITVWDWSRKARLYAVDLPDIPLHVGFSTLGTYLFYTRADWQSVTILEARTGYPKPYLRQGFGIVSFVAFSRTERNLMTYQPSGRITYWELVSGDKIKDVDTLADLSPRRITDDLGTMVARSQSGIAVIDVATGALLAREGHPDLLTLDATPDGSRVFALARSADGRTALSQWSHWSGSLARIEAPGVSQLTAMTGTLTALAAGETAAYVGDERGSIVRLPLYGSPDELSRSNLAAPTAVAAWGQRTALATPGGIWLFEITTAPRLFGTRSLVKEYRVERIAVAGKAEPGVSFLDEHTLAVWDRRGGGLDIHVLEPPGRGIASTGARSVSPQIFDSPLLEVSPAGAGSFVTLEADGSIQMIDRWSLGSLYHYSAPGTRAVAWLSDQVLIGARTRLSRLEHPLIRINTRTGETVPLPDSAFLSYALAADPGRARLFSVALEQDGSGSRTAVRLHDGAGYERSRDILRYAGEDPAASVALDPDGTRLYSSIGFEGVQQWEEGRVTRFETTTHVPRELAAGEGLVTAVNHDRTVSLWETRSGKLLADLYLFMDSSWIAVLPQEDRVHSQGADRYLIER